jgi:hypothetical protein
MYLLIREGGARVSNKTLWIPEDDMPMWDAAERVAKQKKTSLYRVVREALRRDLPRAAAEQPDDWSQIAAEAA